MHSLVCPLSVRLRGRFRGAIPPATMLSLVVFLTSTCSGTTITFTEAGVSALGTPLLVSARLDTAADAGGPNNLLRITLRSFGAPTIGKADVLSSFYFNVSDPDTGIRPALTYLSGSGQAYEVLKSGTDAAVSWSPNLVSGTGTWTTSGPGTTAPSNLVARLNSNEGWQFKTLSTPIAAGLDFGIGTVGNSELDLFFPDATEGFTPQVVSGTLRDSMINLGIYSSGTGTDIVPDGGLDGKRLVRTEAVFTFTSDMDLDSLTETWIQGNVVFGFGTGPDTVLLPEPATPAVAAAGIAVAAGLRMRRKSRLPRAGRTKRATLPGPSAAHSA